MINKLHNENTENSVLSSALNSNESLNMILELEESIFYNNENKKIFKIMSQLNQSDFAVTPATVLSEMTTMNIDNSQLLKLLTIHIISQEVPTLINQLVSFAHKRKIIIHATNLFNEVQNGKADFEKFLSEIEKINIESETTGNMTTMSIYKGLDIYEIFNSDDYISTGYKNLDMVITGFTGGQLIVIAGFPGSGKSTLAWNIALMQQCLFISLEMTKKELFAKALSKIAKVNSQKIIAGMLNESEIDRIKTAREKIESMNLNVIDDVYSYQKIIANIRKAKKQKPEIKVVVIDYLQLMNGAIGDNENERIGTMTRSLKILAKELDVSIIILSQLTKNATARDHIPSMSDLRGSGSIAQDANIIGLIFVDNKDGFDKTIINIEKNRGGATGLLPYMNFNKQFNSFEETNYSDNFENAREFEER